MKGILTVRASLPPLNLKLPVVAEISAMMARQAISVRERRRLVIIHRLCSSSQSRVAEILGHAPKTVRRWCRRALKMRQLLDECAVLPSGRDLARVIEATIADSPRSGAPLTYVAEQQCGIISLAVRKPGEFGLPIETWTHRELAEVASREGIAGGISRRTVTRILNECDLKPHRSKYWENPKIEDREVFEVGNGHVVGARVGDTRTEEDLVSLVADMIGTDPEGDWVFIADRLNTHISEGLVKLVAGNIGGTTPRTHSAVHRLLQPDDGQGIRLDVRGQSPESMTGHPVPSPTQNAEPEDLNGRTPHVGK